MSVITATDSVYVSVGAVEADGLDKASDREDLRTGKGGQLTFTLRFYESGCEPAAKPHSGYKDMEHPDLGAGVTLLCL